MRRAFARPVFLALCVSFTAEAQGQPVESRQAFLVEQLLRLEKLTTVETQAALGAPLTAVRRNLRAAELALAQNRPGQFDALRAELDAQMDYIDALLSRTALESALVQAEAQLAQTTLLLSEAQTRAREAEARAASPAGKP